MAHINIVIVYSRCYVLLVYELEGVYMECNTIECTVLNEQALKSAYALSTDRSSASSLGLNH